MNKALFIYSSWINFDLTIGSSMENIMKYTILCFHELMDLISNSSISSSKIHEN